MYLRLNLFLAGFLLSGMMQASVGPKKLQLLCFERLPRDVVENESKDPVIDTVLAEAYSAYDANLAREIGSLDFTPEIFSEEDVAGMQEDILQNPGHFFDAIERLNEIYQSKEALHKEQSQTIIEGLFETASPTTWKKSVKKYCAKKIADKNDCERCCLKACKATTLLGCGGCMYVYSPMLLEPCMLLLAQDPEACLVVASLLATGSACAGIYVDYKIKKLCDKFYDSGWAHRLIYLLARDSRLHDRFGRKGLAAPSCMTMDDMDDMDDHLKTE